jgi:predicted acyl esterase
MTSAVPPRTVPPGRLRPAPPPSLVVTRHLTVPMADGIGLSTDVYRPAGDGPWPTLLYRTAYDKSRSAIANGALDLLRAVERGYAVAVQDVRGRFGSEGRFDPFTTEGADGADAVAWLADQPWVAGPVGMLGRSYSAAVQWRAAAELGRRGQLELLGALSPGMGGWAAPDGWLFPTGVFALGFAGWWGSAHRAPPAAARTASGDPLALARRIDALYDEPDLALEEAGSEWPDYLVDWLRAAAVVRRGGDPVAAETLPVPAEVPAFHVAGWYDVFCEGDLAGYAMLADRHPDRHRLVVGPWAHGGVTGGNFPGRSFGLDGSADVVDLAGQQLDWFDQWLVPGSGAPTPRAPSTPSAVRTFVTGADRWSEGPQWPPPTTPLVFRLAEEIDGPLAEQLGVQWARALLEDSAVGDAAVGDAAVGDAAVDGKARVEGPWTFTFDADDPTPTVGGRTFLPGLEVAAQAGPADQGPLIRRPDGLVFGTAPLEAATEAAGSVVLSAWAAADPTVSVLVATLFDLAPDGRAELVVRGATRYGRSVGDEVLEPVLLALGSIHHRFGVGHRIGLHVAAGSHPAYDRRAALGPLVGRRTVAVRLWSRADRPSTLTLPVRPGDDGRVGS